MEGGSSIKEQSAGINRGGNIQILTVVDINRQTISGLLERNR